MFKNSHLNNPNLLKDISESLPDDFEVVSLKDEHLTFFHKHRMSMFNIKFKYNSNNTKEELYIYSESVLSTLVNYRYNKSDFDAFLSHDEYDTLMEESRLFTYQFWSGSMSMTSKCTYDAFLTDLMWCVGRVV